MQNELLSCAIRAALLAGKDILNIYDDPKADFAHRRGIAVKVQIFTDKVIHPLPGLFSFAHRATSEQGFFSV